MALKAREGGDDSVHVASRVLKLRRPDDCIACGSALSPGAEAWWDAEAKTVTCLNCHEGAVGEPTPVVLDRGRPGASAEREHQRRKHHREEGTRQAHPRIGGLLLALRDAPQHESAFHSGALGEMAVAESLERRTDGGPAIILHDRRMPGGHGNIDHLAIAPASVFVIDAKNHKGSVKVNTPLFGAPKLTIAGRNHTKLIDGLDRQVAAVRNVLLADHPDVPVQGVLCFTNADLPLLGAPKMRGHLLLYRKSLAKRLNADGPLLPRAIDELARELASAFPPA